MACTVKTESGASLIEITIAILIITVTALVIMSFSRNTLGMSRHARESNAAYHSAERKIIELTSEALPDDEGEDTDEVDGISFTRNWTITTANYITNAIVTVRWNSLKGEREITIAGAIN